MGTPGNSARLLDELVREWELDRDDHKDWIANWPDDQVDDFLHQLESVLAKCTAIAIEAARCDPKKVVLFPEEQSRSSLALLRKCLLYADRTVVTLGVPRLPSDFNPKVQREQIADYAGRLKKVLPFLRTGLVLPASYNAIPPSCKKTIDRIGEGVLEREAAVQALRAYLKVRIRQIPLDATGKDGSQVRIEGEQVHLELDGTFSTMVSVSGAPPEHSVVLPLLPVSGMFNVPTADQFAAREDIRRMLDDLIERRLSNLIRDWLVVTQVFNGGLTTHRELGWALIREIDAAERNKSGISTHQALIDLELPFLEGIPPEAILKERDRNAGALDAFRVALDNLALDLGRAVATATPDDRELVQLRDQHVYAPVRELEAKLREIKSEKYTEIGIAFAVTTSVLTLSLAGPSMPQLPELLQTAINIMGLGTITHGVSQIARERAATKKSPMHILWRLKKYARR